jgi:hypothetical protein
VALCFQQGGRSSQASLGILRAEASVEDEGDGVIMSGIPVGWRTTRATPLNVLGPDRGSSPTHFIVDDEMTTWGELITLCFTILAYLIHAYSWIGAVVGLA